MPKVKQKGVPYPYTIPAFTCPRPAATLMFPSVQWAIHEFFRIEALLRSDPVAILYQKEKAAAQAEIVIHKHAKGRFTYEDWKPNHSLWTNFAIEWGWRVLAGAHHCLLNSPPYVHFAGIINLKMFELGTRKVHPDSSMGYLIDRPERYLLVALDTAFKPHTLIKQLLPLLEAQHKTAVIRSGDFNPAKQPRQFDIKTWHTYLRCYDLYRTQDLSAEMIASKVYGVHSDGDHVEMVKQAIQRVKQLIRSSLSSLQHKRHAQ